MKTRATGRFAVAVLTAWAPHAFAHEGHGVITNPLLHALADPAHLSPLLLTGIALGTLVVALRRYAARNRSRRTRQD